MRQKISTLESVDTQTLQLQIHIKYLLEIIESTAKHKIIIEDQNKYQEQKSHDTRQTLDYEMQIILAEAYVIS